MQNATILLTAASLGFIRTVLGPDHYVPFLALAGFAVFACGAAVKTGL